MSGKRKEMKELERIKGREKGGSIKQSGKHRGVFEKEKKS